MYAAPDQFAASNKNAAEALIGLANAQFAMFERLVALNLKATKTAHDDAINYLRAASSTKDPQELFALNAAAAQPALEKALAYSRSVYEVVAQGQAQLTKMVETQTSDLNKGFTSFLDQYSKGGPAGSDVAVAAIKSALTAASTAYDSYSKVAKQTTELAQANFSAASNVAKEAVKKAAA
jgi:phasin family protein